MDVNGESQKKKIFGGGGGGGGGGWGVSGSDQGLGWGR